jgi:hypothetical protein
MGFWVWSTHKVHAESEANFAVTEGKVELFDAGQGGFNGSLVFLSTAVSCEVHRESLCLVAREA